MVGQFGEKGRHLVGCHPLDQYGGRLVLPKFGFGVTGREQESIHNFINRCLNMCRSERGRSATWVIHRGCELYFKHGQRGHHRGPDLLRCIGYRMNRLMQVGWYTIIRPCGRDLGQCHSPKQGVWQKTFGILEKKKGQTNNYFLEGASVCRDKTAQISKKSIYK